MGRTVLSTRVLLDSELRELEKFRKALRKQDREVFDRIMTYPLLHTSAISYSNRLNLFESIVLAMILEQQKQISEVKKSAK